MEKFFVVDTNVLIHNPQSLYSFADNCVVLPLTVIEELDNFKSSADKKGMHARQVLRDIDRLIKKGALKKGAKMDNGGTLLIPLNMPKPADFSHLDERIKDNQIISTAWHLQQQGKKAFFISKDVNARIKAEAIGIPARDYEKQVVEYGNLYRGWKELTFSKKDTDLFKKDHKIPVNGHTFMKNEYALIKDEENKALAICKYNAEEKCLSRIHDHCSVMGIKPINMEQRFAFDLLLNDDIKLVTLVGQAGTGKTLVALACALSKVLKRTPIYEKLLVARPIIPLGNDIGYLPGNKEKKLTYWMQPIFDNLDFILKKSISAPSDDFSASDLTTDSLMKSEVLEIEALTYIRGRSIPNQFLIVDEAQNLTPHEIKTIISRAGDGTKIVLTGDQDQIDNPYLDANSNGLSYTVDRLKEASIFGHVLLSKSERSGLASLAVNCL